MIVLYYLRYFVFIHIIILLHGSSCYFRLVLKLLTFLQDLTENCYPMVFIYLCDLVGLVVSLDNSFLCKHVTSVMKNRM